LEFIMNANASTSSDFFTDVRHATLGAKVVSTCLGLINFGIAVAVAWSCSSFIVALIAFIVSALVGMLICVLVMMLWAGYATSSMVALGRKFEELSAWLSSKFERAPAPAVAA
jgi:uncharacterized membrane protein YqgA involved in biofilm formation